MLEMRWIDGGRRHENNLKATHAMKTTSKPHML